MFLKNQLPLPENVADTFHFSWVELIFKATLRHAALALLKYKIYFFPILPQ